MASKKVTIDSDVCVARVSYVNTVNGSMDTACGRVVDRCHRYDKIAIGTKAGIKWAYTKHVREQWRAGKDEWATGADGRGYLFSFSSIIGQHAIVSDPKSKYKDKLGVVTQYNGFKDLVTIRFFGEVGGLSMLTVALPCTSLTLVPDDNGLHEVEVYNENNVIIHLRCPLVESDYSKYEYYRHDARYRQKGVEPSKWSPDQYEICHMRALSDRDFLLRLVAKGIDPLQICARRPDGSIFTVDYTTVEA